MLMLAQGVGGGGGGYVGSFPETYFSACIGCFENRCSLCYYHKGYDAVYTVLCSSSSSSSRSHSHIIVVVLVVVVVVVVVVSVVAVALQRQICNNIFVTNERFFLLC